MDNNRLISENVNGITVTYTYDDLGRLSQKQTLNGETVIKTDSYTFTASTVGENATSAQVASYNGYTYTYDDNGNILSVSDGTNTTTYQYDSANQLVFAQCDTLDMVFLWTYDDAGNILSREVYRDKGTVLLSPVFSAADLYQGTADTGKDLSVSYTYNDRDLLSAIVTPTTTYGFEYGNFGLRTKVTIGGITLVSYAYNARNQLTQQTYGNGDFVQFTYDDIGRVTKQTYEDGATVTYAYDNIGNLATVTDSATGIVTTYYYDLLNRQVGYWEKSETLDHRVVYEYNEDNNVSSITETVNGTTKTYSYTYDDDNRLISENADGITVTYTYDDLGRLTQKQTKNGDTVIKTDSYTFTATENGTSTQVASYNGYTYTYDDNGNILSVSDGTNTTTYQYDSANQLVRENNQALGFTKVWTYDNAGNILSRTEYAYTTADDLSSLTATDAVTYQYTSVKWGDMLRVYDGQNLTYDGSGNLTNDGKFTYTWAHGRELVCVTAPSGAQVLATYGADGLRTGRVKTNSSGATAGTYTYVYDGGKLSQMTYGNYVVDITYDAAGTPLTMTVNGQTTYHYVTNLQGDVIALTDDTGAEVITYSYDAWGKVVSRTGTYATLNPLLYRGYVYDWEIHLYYLQSRYYNPEIGRFINADAFPSTGQGFVGNNMFAYCLNNPVNRIDESGQISVVVAAIIKIVISGLKSAAVELIFGGSFRDVAWSFLEGIAYGIGDLIGVSLFMNVAFSFNKALECLCNGVSVLESILVGVVCFLCSSVGIRSDDLLVEIMVAITFSFGADLIAQGVETIIQKNTEQNAPVITTFTPADTSTNNAPNNTTSYTNPHQSPVPQIASRNPSYTGFGFMSVGKTHNTNYSIPTIDYRGSFM